MTAPWEDIVPEEELTESLGILTGDIDDDGRRLVVQRASQIKMRRVSWLWDNRIAAGTISLLAGREGLGKSTLTAWIAAQITTGTLPGDLYGDPRPVIIAATEDSWEHTLTPRMAAAGADLDLVLRVEVSNGGPGLRAISLPTDIAAVGELAKQERAGLLVLDPIISRLEALDTHRDSEVRQALEPLAAMADDTGMAVFGLIHVNKVSNDPLNAVMGSKAFTAVSRSVGTVVADPEDDDDRRRLFGIVKNNLGPTMPGSDVFTVNTAEVTSEDGPITTGRLDWVGSVATSIKSAMDDPGVDSRTVVSEAAEWLEDYLSMSPGAERAEVLREARKAGLSDTSVKRAAAKVGVMSVTEGFPRKARWSLKARADSPVGSRSPRTQLTDPTGPTGPTAIPGGAAFAQVTSSRVSESSRSSRIVSPESDPTGGPTVCQVCGEPSHYSIHPTCEEPR